MAIVEITTGVDLTRYFQVQERIGARRIPGRVLQACYGSEDDVKVITVYDSKEAYARFTESVLLPILENLGLVDLDYREEVTELHSLAVWQDVRTEAV